MLEEYVLWNLKRFTFVDFLLLTKAEKQLQQGIEQK